MAHTVNRYKADIREFHFVLFEQFKIQELFGKAPFDDWSEEVAVAIIDEVHRFGTEVLGPLNAVGDEQGCRLENGQVLTPDGFKEAWQKMYEAGFKSLSISPEFGGQGAPTGLSAITTELSSGPNTAFEMYPGLTIGAAELIEAFGTEEQREHYCGRMFGGTWGGTMCLTEAQAGSDVGEASTTAVKNADGSYAIKGSKIFISGGDQDLTENIIHMVLARTPGAPKGTKGLSLFIVPKHRTDAEGNVTGPNDVSVSAIEHKMGINGSSTCQLAFGDNDACIGYLLGTEETRGMRQMFQMMNYARVGVGLQGLAVASTAYLNALEYAKERKQGPSVRNFKSADAPRVPIIEHPDVRRMLLDMKARVEGIRALIAKGASHLDRANSLKHTGGSESEISYHEGQLELMTPLIKAYSSDQAFRICETAIQVHGGAGYTRDFPVEQYCRDSKIFSIYEGTNHIQALDLVARKLNLGGGQYAMALLQDIGKFVEKHQASEVFRKSIGKLSEAHGAVSSTAMQFMTWFQAGEMERVPLVANRFLKMMSEMVIGWLLLDAAMIACERQEALDQEHPDWSFYEGKKHAARYFALNVLPEVVASAETIKLGDRSPLDIPDAAFATV
ncbi:MAG: acyl-CoA dehydrogenase [Polyangiaceae bacterium]|nr:acyl-CoA dehydrogenase [Polyangiaceae bacterium]MCW5792613.1 acyl-CoA dehydrogenase [Polyangiaceae bacterium]